MRGTGLHARVAAAVGGLSILVLVALAGCTTGDGGGPGGSGSTCVAGDDGRAAARELLERRTTAVRAGDVDDFLATVDPGAAGLRAEQEAWFARVRALPDARVTFAISVNRASGPDRVTTYVSQEVRLRSTDRRALGVEHLATFERRDGCWHLAADQPDPTQVAAAPWDFAGSTVEHRGGVVLVTDIDEGPERARVLDDAVGAWRAARRLVGPFDRAPSDRGVVVMAFRSPEAMQKNGFYHQSLDLTGAVTLPALPGRRPGDVRVIVAPVMLGTDRADELANTLRHEFTHVLLARFRLAPVWATEGVAEFYATRGAPTADGRVTDLRWGAETDGSGLPVEDFYADDGAVRRGNYAVSWAAMVSLARQRGDGEPARLLEALSRAKAGYDPERVDRVLERRYGLTVDQLGVRARAVLAGLG